MEPGLNSSASGKQNLGSDMLLSTWSDRKEAMEKKVAFFLLAILHLDYLHNASTQNVFIMPYLQCAHVSFLYMGLLQNQLAQISQIPNTMPHLLTQSKQIVCLCHTDIARTCTSCLTNQKTLWWTCLSKCGVVWGCVHAAAPLTNSATSAWGAVCACMFMPLIKTQLSPAIALHKVGGDVPAAALALPILYVFHSQNGAHQWAVSAWEHAASALAGYMCSKVRNSNRGHWKTVFEEKECLFFSRTLSGICFVPNFKQLNYEQN